MILFDYLRFDNDGLFGADRSLQVVNLVPSSLPGFFLLLFLRLLHRSVAAIADSAYCKGSTDSNDDNKALAIAATALTIIA